MHLSREQQQLVEDNLALVRKVIKDKVIGAGSIGIFSYEDLYQIGCIGLCKAAYTDKFQYAYSRENAHTEDETRFSTYAYRLIWNEICTKLGYATRVRAETAMPPEELLAASMKENSPLDDGIEDIVFNTALLAAIDCAAQGASGVTAKGIQALLYTVQGYTSSEIGEMMGGVSGNNVTAWISKARKYLQSSPELVALLRTA